MSDIVFDLETKESFDDVGGRSHLERLAVSVLGAYRYDTDEFLMYEESELNAFASLLDEEDVRLVGFNIRGFDIPVLKKYMGPLIARVAHRDIMDDVTSAIGRRLPLDALLDGTLGEGKSGDGLKAIALWRDGNINDLKKYCHDDVRLTRDLYDYGKEHGEVFFSSTMDGSRYRIPVAWGDGAPKEFDAVLEQALQGRLCLAVTYNAGGGEQTGTLEPKSIDETAVEGRLRETDATVRIEKTALKHARLVLQRF